MKQQIILPTCEMKQRLDEVALIAASYKANRDNDRPTNILERALQSACEDVAVLGRRHDTERERCLKAVDDEPEVPGAMPDEMWYAIHGDRDAVENAIRIAVQQTKAGIRARILG